MSETPKPKAQMHEIMVEMFAMVEEMHTNEGQYLQFAELFKQMNININRLAEMKTQLQQNSYYIRHVRQATKITTLRRKRLDEAQKQEHEKYILCNCGRYIHEGVYETHLQTQVHYQGRRNRKYAKNAESQDKINAEIGREVLLQRYIIKHLVKTKNIEIDNEDHDEQGV
jgi:hypothetical protein